MCAEDPLIKLSQSPSGQVKWCRNYGTFRINYQCIDLSFNEEGMIRFRKMLRDIDPDSFVNEFKGEDCVLIRNPKIQMGMILSKYDVDEILELIDSSRAVVDGFRIIYDLQC